MSSHLAVIAGPTAVGKGTVVRYIKENYPNVHLSVSATTRKPRPGEVEGVDYYFLSHDQFDEMIQSVVVLRFRYISLFLFFSYPYSNLQQAPLNLMLLFLLDL